MMAPLPIVEELLNAADDVERARWLLMTPSTVLYHDHWTIRAALVRAGLQAGLTYLATEVAAFCAVRQVDGTHRPEITEPREIARTHLLAVAGAAATLEAAQ